MRFSDWLNPLRRPNRRSQLPARQQRVAAVLETLEDRVMLSGVTGVDYQQVTSEWFGTAGSAAELDVTTSADTSRYIVRLTEWMSSRTGDVVAAESLLTCETEGFRVVGGLGLPGQLLLEIDTQHLDQVVNTLSDHPFVESLEADTTVSGAVLPDDTHFEDLSGLHNTGQGDGTTDADIDDGFTLQHQRHARLQLQLPVKMGGCGITSTTAIAPFGRFVPSERYA